MKSIVNVNKHKSHQIKQIHKQTMFQHHTHNGYLAYSCISNGGIETKKDDSNSTAHESKFRFSSSDNLGNFSHELPKLLGVITHASSSCHDEWCECGCQLVDILVVVLLSLL